MFFAPVVSGSVLSMHVLFVALTARIAFTFSIGLLCISAFAADWPQFRGPTGLGLTDEKELPLKWGAKEKENVRWQVPLKGQGHARPIVSGDAVFVCTVEWPTNSGAREKTMPAHHVVRYRAMDGKRESRCFSQIVVNGETECPVEGVRDLRSRQPILRMALVMAYKHDQHILGANFVKEMVGKAFEVRAPEALVCQMKSQRIIHRLIDGGPQLCVELVSEPRGDFAVVGKSLLDIPPHQRVINYFHVARSRSIDAQNSSELSGRTRPESNSSRRRAASSMPSALASS